MYTFASDSWVFLNDGTDTISLIGQLRPYKCRLFHHIDHFSINKSILLTEMMTILFINFSQFGETAKTRILIKHTFDSIYISLNNPCCLEFEFPSWDWKVVGAKSGRIPAVIYCQSPCVLVRHSTLIIRVRTGTPCFRIMCQGHSGIKNNVKKVVKIQ